MNTFINDAIVKLIYDEGMRIKAINFHHDLDVMVVIEKPYCSKDINIQTNFFLLINKRYYSMN